MWTPVLYTLGFDDYFRPLQQLALSPSTEIFLGLVHASDGAEGTRWRIEVARKYIKAFEARFGLHLICHP